MNIESELMLYMEGKGLDEESIMLFGRPQFLLPKFFRHFFLNTISITW